MAETRSSAAYADARKTGLKYMSEHSQKYLPVLEDKMREIAGEINLGIHEIPLQKVIGTRTAARSDAFAGNFMPVLTANTEFAAKWQSLYSSHLAEGIREPIKVYEYINRYYVQEGNKRVSVLKYLGAVTIAANVIRLIPCRDETDNEVSIYYEFLDFDRRQQFDNLWFTRRGSFTRLVEMTREYMDKHPEITESVADVINSMHRSFRNVYKRCKMDGLPITTGDALVEYVSIFDCPYNVTNREIMQNIRKTYSQLLLISGKTSRRTIEDTVQEQQRVRSAHVKRSKLRAAFVFEGEPADSPWTWNHDAARKRIVHKYGNAVEAITLYNLSRNEDEAFEQLSGLMKQKPDILFATSPNMSDLCLRLTVDYPHRLILNCDRNQQSKNLNTYFSKNQDATFLCGVMAGAMTRSNKIGYVSSSMFHNDLTYGINAYTLGAQLVNPRVEVINYRMRGKDHFWEQNEGIKRLSDEGTDVALCRYFPNNRLLKSGFPGVFGQLYTIDRRFGCLDECLAAAVCDWAVLYDHIIGEMLGDKGSLLDTIYAEQGSTVHFGWGIDTGLVDVLPVPLPSGENSPRLLEIFKGLLRANSLFPFAGPIYDSEGCVQIESGYMPDLEDIQNQEWYVKGAREL